MRRDERGKFKYKLKIKSQENLHAELFKIRVVGFLMKITHLWKHRVNF